jgi:hypothetical protein
MVQMPGFRDHDPLTRPDGETGCVTIPVAAASVYDCGTTLQQSWPVVVVRHYERARQQSGRLALHVADGVGVRESARELEVWPKIVRCWRRREAAEGQSVPERLTDARGQESPGPTTMLN